MVWSSFWANTPAMAFASLLVQGQPDRSSPSQTSMLDDRCVKSGSYLTCWNTFFSGLFGLARFLPPAGFARSAREALHGPVRGCMGWAMGHCMAMCGFFQCLYNLPLMGFMIAFCQCHISDLARIADGWLMLVYTHASLFGGIYTCHFLLPRRGEPLQPCAIQRHCFLRRQQITQRTLMMRGVARWSLWRLCRAMVIHLQGPATLTPIPKRSSRWSPMRNPKQPQKPTVLSLGSLLR